MNADKTLAVMARRDIDFAERLEQLREVIRRTVAKDATDAEFEWFLYLCKQYGLDPFRKEIFLAKDQDGKVDVITSRDGYLKVAMADPNFRGLISFTVREGDEFAIDAQNYTVHHRFGAKRGKILGAWARADHAKRNPVIAYVDFQEYYNPKSRAWQRYPSAMIQKVAEVFVLRRQFNISGLVAQEELGYDLSDEVPVGSPAGQNGSERPSIEVVHPGGSGGDQPQERGQRRLPTNEEATLLQAAWRHTGLPVDQQEQVLSTPRTEQGWAKACREAAKHVTPATLDELLLYARALGYTDDEAWAVVESHGLSRFDDPEPEKLVAVWDDVRAGRRIEQASV